MTLCVKIICVFDHRGPPSKQSRLCRRATHVSGMGSVLDVLDLNRKRNESQNIEKGKPLVGKEGVV